MAQNRKMEKWQGICCTNTQTNKQQPLGFFLNKLQQHNNKSSVLDRDDTNGLQFICLCCLSFWFYGLLFWIVLSFIMMFIFVF